MTRWILRALPVLLLVGLLPLAAPTTASAAPLFTDVLDGHPFYDEIEWLVDEGITTGYPDGTFRPGASITRMAMAAFLYRMQGEPPGPFSPPGFSDVPPTHPFYDEIAWLVSEGITTGFPDGTFRPSASITRQALSAFLHRLAGEPAGPFTTDFTDVPDDHPFALEIGWMVDAEITTGYPDGTFRPGGAVTRQAMAAFLQRYDLKYGGGPDPVVPPDPATIAPALDPTGLPGFWEQVSFLIEGNPPIQTDVTDGAIDHERVAVLRGQVLEVDGTGLPAATVTIVDHPEWGQTLSRLDGKFDLAVEGGTSLLVRFELDGFLPVQRRIQPLVGEFNQVDDVALTELDSAVTAIEAFAPTMQVAQGSEVTDADGTRQNTLVIPAGIGASMEMPDGSVEVLTDMHVRATEYTVGDTGTEAMPGELPDTSGYTYAVDLTVDEALDAGAEKVTFFGTLFNYVDNFLEFPAGTAVPSGYYDAEAGSWKPSDNGIVLEVVSESGGKVNLDVTGDGIADTGTALTDLEITDAERTELAGLYAPGESLWRVPITHFTPWDHNWPYTCDGACIGPDGKPYGYKSLNGCNRGGSVIGCQDQTLGERLPVVGTPYTLVYESDRVPGRTAGRAVKVPLLGGTIPDKMIDSVVTVSVAGQHHNLSYAPVPNGSTVWTWDGKDGYGRNVVGPQNAHVTVSYRYPIKYVRPADWDQAFGWFGTGQVIGNPGRTSITVGYSYDIQVENHDLRGMGFGGWNLDVQHRYDVGTQELVLGTGEIQEVESPLGAATIGHYAGNGEGCDPPACGEGEQAVSAPVTAQASDVGPDGSLYFNDWMGWTIRRIRPDGTVTTVAGDGEPCAVNPATACGTGGPAMEAQFGDVLNLAVTTDGTIYVVETTGISGVQVIRAIGTDGIVRHVAGAGASCQIAQFPCGDGGPGTSANFAVIYDIATGPNNELYIADSARFRRLRPDGVIEHAYGCTAQMFCPWGYVDNVSAQDVWMYVWSFDVAPDGSFYFYDETARVIRQIDPAGILHTVAGSRVLPNCVDDWNCGDGGPALEASFASGGSGAQDIVADDKNVYFTDYYRNPSGEYGDVIRRFTPGGTIERVAGNGTPCDVYEPGTCGDGAAATAASLDVVYGSNMAILPGNHLVLPTQFRLRYTTATETDWLSGDELGMPSSDGSEFYIFDKFGRHLQTRDALTGVTTLTFGYDAGNRLTSLTDRNGNVTTVTRDGSGHPTSIVGPYGQTTTLAVGTSGHLTTVTNPAGETITLDPDAGGLIHHLTDPAGGLHTFTYDAVGRLTRDENPAGGSLDLVRTETATGYIVTTTTAQGRVTTYEVADVGGGAVTRTTTNPAGASTVYVRNPDGSTYTTFPDGTDVAVRYRADPRWGTSAPVLDEATAALPGGTTTTVTFERDVTPSATDVVAVDAMVDTTTTNGDAQVSTWTASTRTRVVTSPEGRARTVVLDAKGQISSFTTAAGITPTVFAYDTHGRLASETAGARSLTYEYDAGGRVSALQDDRGERWSYGYDEVGRRTSLTLPGGDAYALAYDDLGDLTQVTMPDGQVHTQSFTPVGDLSGYDGPATEPSTTTWSPDRHVDSRVLPGGSTVTSTYDAGDRAIAVAHDDAALAFGYVGPTDMLASTTRTPTGGTAQGLTFAYDGSVPTDVTFTGPAAGTIHTTFDDNLRMDNLSVTAGSTLSMTVARDDDGLPTTLGAFTLARGGPGGLLSGITGGGLTETIAYNSFGDLASRTVKGGAITVYDLDETVDDNGRITQQVEVTPAGGTRTTDYTYDADGRLASAQVNGGAVTTYDYDGNGNPTTGPSGAALFDDDDRVTGAGGDTYTYDAAGFLTGRGADTFDYSARGELLSAAVGPDTVTYTYDGLGRRVTRTKSAATTTYLYGNPSNPFQLTASRDSGGVLTLYYYDDQDDLFAFVRGATTFFVATDHLGTPKVVSTTTGVVAKEVRYDAWGQVISDSSPGFDLPVGFAGGLTDPVTGLVHFGFRDYDPAAGHWTSRDPAAFTASSNLYSYVDGDPVNRLDPTGLFNIGASAYEGIGGGFEFATDGQNFSLCGEVGFGAGTAVQVGSGGPAETGVGAGASAQLGCGVAQVTVGGELFVSDCDVTTEIGVEGGVGPFAGKVSSKTGNAGTETSGQGTVQFQGGSSAKVGGGCSVQAKVYVKGCVGSG